MINPKKMWRKIFYYALHLVNIGIIFVVGYLQMLTTQKAGVNHHLIYMKTYYEHNLFTRANKIIASIILLLVLAFIIKHLILSLKKRKIHSLFSFVMIILCILILLLAINNILFSSLLVYPYIIFAGFIILFVLIVSLFIANYL